MRKRFTLMKTLLAAVALGAGVNSAWADDIAYNYELVSQNFSDVSSESVNWTNLTNNVVLAQTTRLGDDKYYTITYGGTQNGASTVNYNFPDLTSYSAYKISFLWGAYSCSATGRSSLFKIVGSSADFATTGNFVGQSTAVNLTAGETSTTLAIDVYGSGTRGNANRTSTLYNITIEGVSTDYDAENAGVYLTITNEGGDVTQLTRTKISNYQTITSLHFECGQYYGQQAIDDILVKAYSSIEVVPDPSAEVTGVNLNARTVTINLGNNSSPGTTIKYYTAYTGEEGADPTDLTKVTPTDLTTYSAPFSTEVTKLYYYAESTSGVKSNVQTCEVNGGFTINLATPSVALKTATVGTGSLTAKFTINAPDNKDITLKPATETLAYTFTPAGGVESGRTTISSGDEYTPTALGTLTVYASTTGYGESSYSIPVSDLYVVSSTNDYTTGISTEGLSAGANWGEDITAYRVNKGTWKRLNIQNDNTIDYVVDYGFSRKGNTYTYRVRNSINGEIFNVTMTSVAAEPALTYQQTLCTSGTGNETDVTNFSAAVGANLAVKQIDFYSPVASTIPAAITSASGFATLYTDYALDFSTLSGELTAYTAAYDGEKVTLTQVDDVPAGTGVVLKGDVKTHNIPVIASSTTAKGDLLGSTTEATAHDAITGKDLYMLALNGEGKAQFTKVNDGSIAAGKAYLAIASDSPAPALEVVFAEGGTTAIETVRTTVADSREAYNLAGQKVGAGYKGIVIVNGRKAILTNNK